MEIGFPASFHDTCASCGGHINPGDMITYEGGDIVHAVCPRASAIDREEAKPPCTKCFIIHPEGDCD